MACTIKLTFALDDLSKVIESVSTELMSEEQRSSFAYAKLPPGTLESSAKMDNQTYEPTIEMISLANLGEKKDTTNGRRAHHAKTPSQYRHEERTGKLDNNESLTTRSP